MVLASYEPSEEGRRSDSRYRAASQTATGSDGTPPRVAHASRSATQGNPGLAPRGAATIPGSLPQYVKERRPLYQRKGKVIVRQYLQMEMKNYE